MRFLRILGLAFILLPLIPIGVSARTYCGNAWWVGNRGHYSYYEYRCKHRHRWRHHRDADDRARSWYHRHLDRD